MGSGVQTNTQCHNVDSHVDSVGICKQGGGSTITLASGPTSLTDTADTNVVDISVRIACAACNIEYLLGRGLKTKSWNIKTRLAELGVFMHKFAIENDPKP